MGLPLSVSKAKFYHLHTSTWLSSSTSHSLGLPPPPCPNSGSSLPPHTKARGTHIPILPFWAWYPLMRPRVLDMAIWKYHRRSDWSQDHDGCYFSSWNDLAVEKTASKSSAVSAQEGGMLYWPACWVAYKRKSRRASSLVCSQQSTPPQPSGTQPELHHLDAVCWISKLSSQLCHFPINQAKLGAPSYHGHALSYQSGKNGRALLPGAHPFLSIRQNWTCPSHKGAPFLIYQAVCQELRMDGGIAKLGSACRNWTRTVPRRLFIPALQ